MAPNPVRVPLRPRLRTLSSLAVLVAATAMLLAGPAAARRADRTPPDTRFGGVSYGGGPTTTSTSGTTTAATYATFSFSSTESGSTFRCSLDSGSWYSCTSGVTVSKLSVGAHSFRVAAIDRAGNVDPTPVVVSWTVASSTTTPTTPTTTTPTTTVSPSTPPPLTPDYDLLMQTAPARQPYRFGGQRAGAYNEPIPTGAGLDPASGTIVSRMVSDMQLTRMGLIGAAPIYAAATSDAPYTITVDPPWGGHFSLRFRIPAGATTSGTWDSPLIVYDPNAQSVSSAYPAVASLRLWLATIDHATRTVSAQGFGIFDAGHASEGAPVQGWGTGDGLSLDAALVRRWELDAGEIRHALRMAAPPPSFSSAFRAPATKSDQGGSGPLAMGMRLQLDPAVDCATRTVPGRLDTSPETRYLRMICRALQRYGAIVSDGSGGAHEWQVQTEDESTAHWSSVLNPPYGLLGNIIRDRNASLTRDGVTRSATDGVPWDRMRVLAAGAFSS